MMTVQQEQARARPVPPNRSRMERAVAAYPHRHPKKDARPRHPRHPRKRQKVPRLTVGITC